MSSKIVKQSKPQVYVCNTQYNKKLLVLTKIEILSMKLTLLENELLKR
jgi:hypothetical protein